MGNKYQGKYYRLNQNIQAKEVRVIDEKAKQIGIMSLPEALKKAQEERLDLVEVAPGAQPPVCKIIDFKKFKFLEAKKTQKEKRSSKKTEQKEIRLTPFMAENDLNFRLERVLEFLEQGNKVKVFVFFRGRELTKKEFGYEIIKKALERLKPYASLEVQPRFIGRRLEMILAPLKGGSNEQKKDENQKVN